MPLGLAQHRVQQTVPNASGRHHDLGALPFPEEGSENKGAGGDDVGALYIDLRYGTNLVSTQGEKALTELLYPRQREHVTIEDLGVKVLDAHVDGPESCDRAGDPHQRHLFRNLGESGQSRPDRRQGHVLLWRPWGEPGKVLLGETNCSGVDGGRGLHLVPSTHGQFRRATTDVDDGVPAGEIQAEGRTSEGQVRFVGSRNHAELHLGLPRYFGDDLVSVGSIPQGRGTEGAYSDSAQGRRSPAVVDQHAAKALHRLGPDATLGVDALSQASDSVDIVDDLQLAFWAATSRYHEDGIGAHVDGRLDVATRPHRPRAFRTA